MPTMIDAYSHVGLPRFCSPGQILDVCDRWNIAKVVMSLGPGTPDIAPLAEAVRTHPDRVRAVGIPFGATEDQRHDIVLRQLDAGFMGIRLSLEEATGNPRIMEAIGERGGWIYFCGIPVDQVQAELLIGWLNAHPHGQIAAPHFLNRTVPDMQADEHLSFRRLLEHPRFFPILSRQGDGRSGQKYPFGDLLPWARMLVGHCSWSRILWGSEHPVLLWRDETMKQCIDWITDAGIGATEEEIGMYLGGNAERVFFTDRPDITRDYEQPAWLEPQFDRGRILSLFQNATLDVPMDRFEPIMAEYLYKSQGGTTLTFGEFVANRLLGKGKNASEEIPFLV